MLARRGSAAPVVDDLHLPYPRVSHPSSFDTPEGEYSLAYEVFPPPPATPATPGAGNAAAALAAQGNPEYPATLATAVIRFPAASASTSSGLLGLGGSQRQGRTREASISQEAPPLPDDQASSSNSASSYDNNNNNGIPIPGNSPVSGRRKPLVSLPSMPSMLGSSNGGYNPPPSATPSTTKPKNAFRGTSSTFVKAYEGLPLSVRAEKLWQGVDPRDITLAVFTSPRAVFIADISPRAKTRDPIARMAFAAVPTTTAINYSTLCHERMDILVGFNTGDIFWIEAFSGRYTRYNKDASSMAQTLSNNKSISVVSSAPVKKVQWLQGDQLFATAFQDGCIAFWDKDREDPNSFTPSPGCAPDAGPSSAVLQPVLSRYSSHLDGNSESHETNGDDASAARQSSYRRHTQSREQLEERTDDIIVTVPQLANEKDKKAAKINPIAHWKVSRKPITDFAISPDNAYCAVVSEDGCLRIIDCNSQKLLDTFEAYFGALTCVSWSPDGRFVLTGGQDDLACVWSPFEQRIVARCEGHSSFLTGLAFDAWRCDSRTQRFASVSEDCKLILWDLSSAALQRPKGHHQHHHHGHGHGQQLSHAAVRRMSGASALSLVRKRTIEGSSANLPSTAGPEREAPLWHRAPNRSEVPGLQPVVVKQISTELLSGISFLPNMIVTVSRNATVKVWIRPEARY